jgi:hypothetical protein
MRCYLLIKMASELSVFYANKPRAGAAGAGAALRPEIVRRGPHALSSLTYRLYSSIVTGQLDQIFSDISLYFHFNDFPDHPVQGLTGTFMKYCTSGESQPRLFQY